MKKIKWELFIFILMIMYSKNVNLYAENNFNTIGISNKIYEKIINFVSMISTLDFIYFILGVLAFSIFILFSLELNIIKK
ncbi:hypothetical protein EV215_1039 [Hypnocyclicus thermotrophus]|uniref:Uncharacterized protein n=1 Tax=Hypnocyclicus thermotrophus TaxID=1627895 RepID=A0AA46I5P7_9FUSO|nr:hypothetical protein [Hypnocyclicus thermotrophus]TDT70494.1 hypothetical protein EV215_1039 [Hypnocyclicus thermotrophus]